MGGSVRTGYRNRPYQEPEYNILVDPEAAKAVFNSSSNKQHNDFHWASFYLAPLDTAGDIQLEGAEFQLLRFARELASNSILQTLFEQYRVWCVCPNSFVVNMSECQADAPSDFCFQNNSIAMFPFNPTNASTNLYDAMPPLMAAAMLSQNQDLPSIPDMVVINRAKLAVDDFVLTIPSYSDYGIGEPGGKLISTALAWTPATTGDGRDGGLQKFKSAFATSLATHDSRDDNRQRSFVLPQGARVEV